MTTYFACGPRPGDNHPDEWMLAGLVDDGTDQAAEIQAADALDRLMCDCCQEYQIDHHGLTRSGAELLCVDCCGVAA